MNEWLAYFVAAGCMIALVCMGLFTLAHMGWV